MVHNARYGRLIVCLLENHRCHRCCRQFPADAIMYMAAANPPIRYRRRLVARSGSDASAQASAPSQLARRPMCHATAAAG